MVGFGPLLWYTSLLFRHINHLCVLRDVSIIWSMVSDPLGCFSLSKGYGCGHDVCWTVAWLLPRPQPPRHGTALWMRSRITIHHCSCVDRRFGQIRMRAFTPPSPVGCGRTVPDVQMYNRCLSNCYAVFFSVVGNLTSIMRPPAADILPDRARLEGRTFRVHFPSVTGRYHRSIVP